MAINLGSELVIQDTANEKRISMSNGTKTYTVTKNIGSFIDVFKGVDENTDKEATTLVCEVPLKAQIYKVKLQLVPKSGQNTLDTGGAFPTTDFRYPIARVNMAGSNKILETDVSVIPVSLARDLPSNVNDYDNAVRQMLSEYRVSAADSVGYNLYGCKLVEGYFYPITRFITPIYDDTANQSINRNNYERHPIMDSKYGALVSCRHGCYNIFRDENNDKINALDDDGGSLTRFSLASIFRDPATPILSEKLYNKFNAGTGTIILSSTMVAQDGTVVARDIFNALFADGIYNETDVICQVVYGETYADDITAFSTKHFIR